MEKRLFQTTIGAHAPVIPDDVKQARALVRQYLDGSLSEAELKAQLLLIKPNLKQEI